MGSFNLPGINEDDYIYTENMDTFQLDAWVPTDKILQALRAAEPGKGFTFEEHTQLHTALSAFLNVEEMSDYCRRKAASLFRAPRSSKTAEQAKLKALWGNLGELQLLLRNKTGSIMVSPAERSLIYADAVRRIRTSGYLLKNRDAITIKRLTEEVCTRVNRDYAITEYQGVRSAHWQMDTPENEVAELFIQNGKRFGTLVRDPLW